MRCKFPCHYFDVYAFQSNKTHMSKMLTATPSLLYSHRRVSSDTSAHWDVMLMHKIMASGDGPPCLKNALHFSITRSFLHRKWWLNDPDCVILPGTGLTSSEMILQLTIICMSGGVVVISEDMPSLDLNNFALLKKILPTSQLVCGQPRNVLLHRFPKLYVCSGSDPSQRSSLFAFINWKSFNVTLNSKIDLEDELRYISNTAVEDGTIRRTWRHIFQLFLFRFLGRKTTERRFNAAHEASQYQDVDNNTV